MGAGVVKPTEAYASVEDVAQLLPHRSFTAESKPSAAQVTQALKDVASIINGHLRAVGFSPALTNSDDVQILKHINALGAAILAESQKLGQTQGDSPLIDRYQEEYSSYLKKIVNGDIVFSGAGAPPNSDADGNDDLDTSGDRADPIFMNSEDQRKNQF